MEMAFMTTDLAVGVGGIVLGIITSYIFHLIQKRRKELSWAIDSTNLIKGYSSLFEKLEIQYGEKKIENLTVSKVAFWNNGNETIDGKDIAIPPFILPTDKTSTKILDTKIIKISTVGNRFEIHKKIDSPFLVLKFDYLDPQQGAVIQIIHTGVSVLPLIMRGEIKGVKDIKYKSKKPDIALQMPRVFIYFNALIMFVLFGIYLYSPTSHELSLRDDWTMWALVLILLLSIFFAIFDIRHMRDTAKIPKGLSVFEKDEIGIKRRN